eukprot:2486607-Amphidinium_carterae.1
MTLTATAIIPATLNSSQGINARATDHSANPKRKALKHDTDIQKGEVRDVDAPAKVREQTQRLMALCIFSLPAPPV